MCDIEGLSREMKGEAEAEGEGGGEAEGSNLFADP